LINLPKILLIDDGMNTGNNSCSQIGGGQIARKRLFLSSFGEYFNLNILTSNVNIVNYWKENASIFYHPELSIYRPSRTGANFNIFKIMIIYYKTSKVFHRIVKNIDPSIIIINDNKNRILFIIDKILNNRMKYKTVIEADGEWNLGPYDWSLKYLYSLFFDIIICPSYYMKKQILVPKLFNKSTKIVIYPGVNKPDGNQQKVIKLGENKTIVFGCIGTLNVKIKGQDTIIEAVNILKENFKELNILVKYFGDGPDLAYLKEMIYTKNLSKYFEFCGYVEDVSKIYNSIHVTIVSSYTETASIVTIESLIRNIPIVYSDLPVLQEIIGSCYNGYNFKYKAGNSIQLASILSEIILNPHILNMINIILSNSNKNKYIIDYQVDELIKLLR